VVTSTDPPAAPIPGRPQGSLAQWCSAACPAPAQGSASSADFRTPSGSATTRPAGRERGLRRA
jgi:hypothetical protein